MPAPPRSARRELGLWLLLVALVRGLSIVALSDVFFYGEELEKGAAAKAMLDGIDIAHHKLSYHYYEGGGFAISHLKALLFTLVGENLLAQRLGGLLTCLLVFWAFWRLIDHHFGRRAARCGALLFLLGPASFQRYSLLSLGIHFEAMAFGLVILDEGLRLAFEREREPSLRRMVALGAVAGFGLFFSYQNALVIGWAGLLFLVFRPRVLFGPRGLASLGGFVLGLAPLLYMAAHVGDALLDIHGQDLREAGGLGRVVVFLRVVYLEGTTWELVSRVAYPAAAVVAIGLGLTRLSGPSRRAYFGVLGFVALWMLAWLIGPFLKTTLIHWFDWLRMAPLTLALMILAAAAVDAAWTRLAKGLLAAVVVLGLVHTGSILAEGRLGTPLRNLDFLVHTKGYDYRGYFPMLMGHLESRRLVDVAPLLQFDEPHPSFLQSSFAICLYENRRRSIEVMEQLGQLEGLDAEGRDGFLLGLGASVLVHRRGDVGAALIQLEGLPAPMGERLAEGVAYFPGHRVETRELLLEDLAAHGRGPLGAAYTRGLGMRAFRVLVLSSLGLELCLNEGAVRDLLAQQDPDLAPLLLEGFEQERARWTLP
jgi:hypothetical protein